MATQAHVHYVAWIFLLIMSAKDGRTHPNHHHSQVSPTLSRARVWKRSSKRHDDHRQALEGAGRDDETGLWKWLEDQRTREGSESLRAPDKRHPTEAQPGNGRGEDARHGSDLRRKLKQRSLCYHSTRKRKSLRRRRYGKELGNLPCTYGRGAESGRICNKATEDTRRGS